jgi:hypothetical protein
MSFIDSRLTKFIFFSSLLIAFFACTKITNTNIGSGLIPPVDGVNTKDTIIDVITKNQSFDTVAVGFSDDHVLGYTNDPVFGTTNAAVNFQVALSNSGLSFETNSVDSLFFDSVVLSLSYKGVWGDSSSRLGLHVYEMDPENKFTVDSAYNNKISFEKGNELTESGIGTDVDITKLNDPDTLKYYNEDATNQVRIRLSQTFGQKLLFQYRPTDAYQNDSTFHNFIRGFIVEAEQRGNALLSVNLSDTSTRLSLYYHYRSTTGALDSGIRRFPTSALTCASSNTIIRNYTGTAIPNYFPSNSNAQDDLLFIQTSPGTYARIKIPGLVSLPNMLIHRAEILMTQVPADANSDKLFTAPNLFLAAYSQDSGRRFAVPNDLIFSGGAYTNLTSFGILPIKKTDALSGEVISTYSFDISRYVQGVVTRKDPIYDFILWAPYNYNISPTLNFPYAYPISTPALNAVAIGRVRLGGGNNSQYKMRLHIVYSPSQ